jgi:hypothetical protein
LSDNRGELARSEGAQTLVRLVELRQVALRRRFEPSGEGGECDFSRNRENVGAPEVAKRELISYVETGNSDPCRDSRCRHSLLCLRWGEPVARGLL